MCLWRIHTDRLPEHDEERSYAAANSTRLGLGKYEAACRENEIDETVLPSLTHETLKELGCNP